MFKLNSMVSLSIVARTTHPGCEQSWHETEMFEIVPIIRVIALAEHRRSVH